MAAKKTLDTSTWPAPGNDVPDLRIAFAAPGARVFVAGTLATGTQLVVHDPMDGPEGMDPLPLEVPSGKHSLHLGLVSKKRGTEAIAAAALVLSDRPPARWERLCAFQSDSGFAGFLKPEAAFWLDEGDDGADEVLAWSQGEPSTKDDRFFAARGNDLIALRSGKGTFVVYVARAADGSPALVVAGFGVLEGDAALKSDRLDWETVPEPKTRIPAILADTAASDAFRRELSETAELVVDDGPRVEGRDAVIAALEELLAGGLIGARIGSPTKDGAHLRAPLLMGQGRQLMDKLPKIVFADPDPVGEIEVELAQTTITRIRVTRARGSPVPAVTGKTQAEAIRALQAAGYRFGMLSTQNDPSPDGTVLSQSRTAGSVWPLATAVNLVISCGPARSARKRVQVPDLAGLDVGAARSAARAVGLDIEVGTPLEKAKGEAGKVAAQEPPAGKSAVTGDTIVVRFPPEEEKVFLPTLDGLSQKDAEFRIKLVGLKKGEVKTQPGDVAEGTVIASTPAGGSDVPAGTKVDLIVCKR
jgi:hypothetical protein